MSYKNVGKVWDVQGFKNYLSGFNGLGWAKGVTLHHTWNPDLNKRPRGFKIYHIRNLRYFYQKILKWSRGPHGFIDEDQLWGLSPFSASGTHARSFNRDFIGLEILGNYDKDDPKTGRGAKCWNMTFDIVALLFLKMGLEANEKTVKFHSDDPRTNKSCPGSRVDKQWVIDGVKASMIKLKADDFDKMDDSKPLIPGFNNYKVSDGEWCVPVVSFMNHFGVKNADLKLSRNSYNGRILNTIFYDRATSSTWASVKELLNLS